MPNIATLDLDLLDLFDLDLDDFTVTPTAVAGESDVIDDVIDRLMATGEFSGVFWGEPPESHGRPAEMLAMALVEPDSWSETDEFDDEADYQSVVRGTFLLTLFSRDRDPRRRDRALRRLADAAKDAINEKSLAGLTIPGLTILRRGKYQKASNPERQMTIVGEYAYFVDGPTGHDTSA